MNDTEKAQLKNFKNTYPELSRMIELITIEQFELKKGTTWKRK